MTRYFILLYFFIRPNITLHLALHWEILLPWKKHGMEGGRGGKKSCIIKLATSLVLVIPRKAVIGECAPENVKASRQAIQAFSTPSNVLVRVWWRPLTTYKLTSRMLEICLWPANTFRSMGQVSQSVECDTESQKHVSSFLHVIPFYFKVSQISPFSQCRIHKTVLSFAHRAGYKSSN